MARTIKLNDLQLILLTNAAQRDSGQLLPAPASVAADAKRIAKEIGSLLRRGLVADAPATTDAETLRRKQDERFGAVITDAGRAAIGVSDDDAADDEHADADAVAPDEGSDKVAAPDAPAIPASPRPASKIALVLTMLGRAEGATLVELTQASGWQPHSTRAALTGLRKKGHAIVKDKRGDTTCYRIGTAS